MKGLLLLLIFDVNACRDDRAADAPTSVKQGNRITLCCGVRYAAERI
jgi:hypothetical protein